MLIIQSHIWWRFHICLVQNQQDLLVSFIRTSKILKFTTWAELIHFTCDWSPINTLSCSDNTISSLFISKQELIRSELDFILSNFLRMPKLRVYFWNTLFSTKYIYKTELTAVWKLSHIFDNYFVFSHFARVN